MVNVNLNFNFENEPELKKMIPMRITIACYTYNTIKQVTEASCTFWKLSSQDFIFTNTDGNTINENTLINSLFLTNYDGSSTLDLHLTHKYTFLHTVSNLQLKTFVNKKESSTEQTDEFNLTKLVINKFTEKKIQKEF